MPRIQLVVAPEHTMAPAHNPPRRFTSVLLALLLAAPAGVTAWVLAAQSPPERKAEPTQEPAAALPLARGKKLILKDGSDQIARSYEVRGERVRYYSVERSAWEELPAEMVDWEATRKAEAESAERLREAEEKARSMRTRAIAEEVETDTSVEIAPGVFLPDVEGMYLVDGTLILPLTTATADIKRDKGRLLAQILVPVPVVPTLHKVMVPGKAAETRVTNPNPEFYFRMYEDYEPELELIRAKVKGDAREIQRISTYLASGQYTDRDVISVERWRVARRLFRLTLSQSLEPGEYVLAEILPDGLNLYVWDFAINPAAGAPAAEGKQKSPPRKP